MAVPLLLFVEMSIQPSWGNFFNHVKNQCGCDTDRFISVAEDILAHYGASTNWEDQEDPLWFPDEDSRTRFVLAWS